MSDYGIPSEYREELRRIVSCVKHLRTAKPGKVTSWEKAAECHIKYSNLYGSPVLALTITLSPTGCEWARKGGCTMCGEFEGSLKRKSLIKNPQFHVSQFAAAIGDRRIWELAHNEERPISWLRINQEGNYTNKNEMSVTAQETILRLAIRIKGIQRITIESRPQYITEDSVAFLRSIFEGSGVELEIGMGMEAVNDVVRNVCINKQGTKEQFASAATLLRKNNMLPLAYVLLKPPFLTEMEAIEEATDTAHFAHDAGFSRISFEPMTIHHYTLVDALAKAGYYTPPWLWSVIEVAKRCSDISHIFGIGGVGYYPIPKEYSSNQCSQEPNCTEAFARAIKQYNASRDVSIFDGLSCDCQKEWITECAKRGSPFKDRMQEQLTKVEEFLPGYSIDEARDVEDVPLRNARILFSYSQ